MSHSVYTVSKEFLTSLRNAETYECNVIDPKITTTYYGPFDIDGKKLYAPIAVNKTADRPGVWNEILNFDKAIEIPDDMVREYNGEPSNLIRICINSDDILDDFAAEYFKAEKEKAVRADAACRNEYGVYTIQNAYLSALHSADPNVMKSTDVIAYCGPILRRNNMNWYAPVTKTPYKDGAIMGTYHEGVLCEIVHLHKLIPCPDSVTSKFSEETPETLFCIEMKDAIINSGIGTFDILENEKYKK